MMMLLLLLMSLRLKNLNDMLHRYRDRFRLSRVPGGAGKREPQTWLVGLGRSFQRDSLLSFHHHRTASSLPFWPMSTWPQRRGVLPNDTSLVRAVLLMQTR